MDMSDADLSNMANQSMAHKKKHSLTNKTLIDTSQFDSKSFINRSDGFNNRSLNFAISKSDKSLDKVGNNSTSNNKNVQNTTMMPILIVSKSKKLINLKNLQNTMDSKLTQKQYSPQDLFKAHSHQHLNSENYFNYDPNKQVIYKRFNLFTKTLISPLFSPSIK